MAECDCNHAPDPSEVARNTAEASKFKAEARKQQAEAKKAEVELQRLERVERDELARDAHHHLYVFDDAVTEASVKKCIQQLTLWARQDPKCPIEIQVNSPGGSIFDGFALIDFVRGLREQGHTITTVAIGMAASMGGVILQAGDKRVMGKYSFMLLHEGSLGASGDFAHVEDRVALMKLFHEKILDLFTERSNKSKRWIKARWERKDWWLDAQTALEHGFVDEIR